VPRTAVSIGSCNAVPGQLSYGSFQGPELPTGGADALAVIIAQGLDEGPVFWLTANIHGDEVAGIPVLHRLLTPELCKALRGTIVCIPSLNPAGLRIGRRNPYYDDRDPNRTFPGVRRDLGENREPTVYERLATTVLDAIRTSADFYLDLHCASILSVPFVIRDRVLYRKESEKAAAQLLSDRIDEMAKAFGFPAVTEYSVKSYIGRELHRSSTGAALQELHLPTFTVELGPHSVADSLAVRACVIGLRNVLRWAGMLPGENEPMPVLPMAPQNVRLRREDGPYPSAAGLLDFRVVPGAFVKAGGVVAELRDMWGRPVGDGAVRVATDAWLLSIEDGILAYPGGAIAHIAVADDSPVVDAWPDDIR